jgi:hypothetical protein
MLLAARHFVGTLRHDTLIRTEAAGDIFHGIAAILTGEFLLPGPVSGEPSLRGNSSRLVQQTEDGQRISGADVDPSVRNGRYGKLHNTAQGVA